MRLHKSGEDYLEAILVLHNKKGSVRSIDIADYIGLTSVNQNLEESGRMAARLGLERIKDRERGSVVMRVPISVIERETTGK